MHLKKFHVTKCDNNFPKRIFFGKLHYGLSSGKKISQGKNYVYATINFNKKVTAVTKKMQRGRANILKAILGYIYGKWRARGYRNIVSHTYKIISKIAKQSIEGVGSSLLRKMEVHEPVQFRFILYLPVNT